MYCLIWNFSEYSKISLGTSAPAIFSQALGCKKRKIK